MLKIEIDSKTGMGVADFQGDGTELIVELSTACGAVLKKIAGEDQKRFKALADIVNRYIKETF